MVNKFRHLGNPSLIFGAGALAGVPELTSSPGPVLVVTGAHFAGSKAWHSLEEGLKSRGITFRRETVSGEPSPETVDSLTAEARKAGITAVLAVGGGSVMDTGKAVAAMVRHEGGVADYLEGVGSRKPEGRTVPVIAVPTTAGTGSEATKNAVIGRKGKGGYKKSLRHDAFIPAVAVLDPELAAGCPSGVTMACAMDAFCQLLESWLSTGATPFTDMLGRDGLVRFGAGSRLFTEQLYGTPEEIGLRGELALAAYASGLNLANAGLGTVHGIAGPLCGQVDVPHGTACGLLAGPVFRRIAKRLQADDDRNNLDRMAFAGAALRGGDFTRPGRDDIRYLLDRLDEWAADLPRLSRYGMTRDDIDLVAAASNNKESPVVLDESERRDAIMEVL